VQAADDGYQAFNIEKDEDLFQGIATPEETAPQVRNLIERALNKSGADKAFVIAHSRGGIFARQALRMYQNLASAVAGYFTISTAHHGIDGVELLGLGKCSEFLSTGRFLQCLGAAKSLATEPMREFNYGRACTLKQWDLAELFDTKADYSSQLDNNREPPQAFCVYNK
jgi:pimeloyl-ACP methyl ester carboxylesterase